MGGKGGVGKTTCAAALGIAAASRDARTLVVSTDPAPSLGDALAVRLGAAPRPVRLAKGELHAMQVDAPQAVARWLRRRRRTLATIVSRGTWLDEEDVSKLLRLALPGIDEIGGLLEIARLGGTGQYDLVVIDTAPTGHTLRMLAMPETLAGVARVFDWMQAKHRAVVQALRGYWAVDEADQLIAELESDARKLRELFADRRRTTASWVTLPESMAVAESLDAIEWLVSSGIPLGNVIVNRVTSPPPEPCSWCGGRRALEHAALRQLERALKSGPHGTTLRNMQVRMVRARENEPIGIFDLSKIGSELESSTAGSRPASTRPRPVRVVAIGVAKGDCVEPFEAATAKLVLFGGKGGVGKTTCAAAAALDAAARHPHRRVLLVSIDPAHSLADALGVRLSDRPRVLRDGPRNLEIRELDSEAAFRRVRDGYAVAVDALFDRLSRGSAFDATHDRRVMHGLMDLAPPGIDELAAVLDVTDAIAGSETSSRYDLIIMDTAPSGHALRLLETPAIVQDWARTLMRIVLKYEPVVGVGDLGRVLLQLSQGIGRLRARLADHATSQFVMVTRAATLPRAESRRLLEKLEELDLNVRAVIVNAIGAGECTRCVRTIARERRQLSAIRREVNAKPGARQLVQAPAELPPPQSPPALRRWRRRWR